MPEALAAGGVMFPLGTDARVGTWAAWVRNDPPQEEEWVHAAVIDQLLAIGIQPTSIRYEHWLSAHSRCDVTVVVPGIVLVIECKRLARFANSTAAIQVRRYKGAARQAFPDHKVHGFLVWPMDEHEALEWREIL